MARGQAIGSAGELIVQARLLVRGWTTGNVNAGGMMNAPAIDLLAMKGARKISIAVKTTGHGAPNVQWNMKPGWTTLFKGDVRPDYVVFVWFTARDALDDCRIFVVPAKVVDAAVLKSHAHWHERLRRDGKPHKDNGHVAFTWTGNVTAGNIARGFAEKWTKYENAWGSLEQVASSDSKARVASSDSKLAAKFKARPGTFRWKLLVALEKSFGKQVAISELCMAVYGSDSKVGPLMMCLNGAILTIVKEGLPYEIKKEKDAIGIHDRIVKEKDAIGIRESLGFSLGDNGGKYSKGEQRIFALLSGKKVSSTDIVARHYGTDEPINGRRIVIGTLSSLRRKIAANNEPFRLMSTERSGPHAMEFWLEKARTGKG